MSASPTMQRYAAEIYRLQQDHEQVPLSLLTSHVDSSAQAISSMVKRLQKLGFLVHEPYRGVRLTAEGERIAMPSLRRHRLTEVFLVKVMKYDWAAAHELSDTFEKVSMMRSKTAWTSWLVTQLAVRMVSQSPQKMASCLSSKMCR